MNKSSLLVRKGVVGLTVLTFILLFFGYYFSVYTPVRENELNQRGFRILGRVEENIFSKKKNILNIIDKVLSKQLPIEMRKSREGKKLKRIYDSIQHSHFQTIPGGGEKYRKSIQDSTKGKQDVFQEVRHLHTGYMRGREFNGLKYTNLISLEDWKKKFENSQFYPQYDDYTDNWKIYFFGKNYTFITSQASQQDTLVADQNSCIMYEYEVENFVKDILFFRDDFFKEYLILQNDSIVYQTKNSSQQLVYKGDCGALNDSSVKKNGKSRLLSDHIQLDTIAGKEYYVFYHPFEISSKINFTLCGLIPADEYNAVKYRLNVPDILMITLLLVIVIISFPIIKIVFMSKFERLTKFDVFSLMTAMVLGTSVVTIFFLFSVHKKNEEEKQYKRISRLNDLVKQNFLKELDTSLDELIIQRLKYQVSPAYSQWLSTNIDREFCTNTNTVKKFFNTKDSIEFCQYTESMLFIDSSGVCQARWSEGVDNSPDINLNERDYVSHFLNKTKERLYTINGTQFYLQPIYSWQDGANTVVVSKQDKEFDDRISIVALETRFFSVTNPIISKELGFCIINKEGDVLFHSDNNRNLRENFIEETGKNSQLLSAIYSRTKRGFEFNYTGKEHQGYIAPIKDLPFYVVSFYDKTVYFDSEANITMFTIVLLSALFGILIIVLFVFACLTKRTTYLRKQLNVRFIRFSYGNYSLYKKILHYFLVINSVGILLSLCMVYTKDSLNQLYLSVSIPLVCMLVVAKLILRKRMFQSTNKYKKNHFIFKLLFLGCWVVATIVTIRFGTFTQRLCTMGMASVLLIVYYWEVQNCRILFRNRAYKKYQGIVVALVVFTFLFNSSIFPTVNFYMVAAEEDNLLSIKRSGLELSERAEERANWLYGNPKFTNVMAMDSLDFTTFKKGIYTEPLQVNSTVKAGEFLENYISKFFVSLVYLSKLDLDEYEIHEKLLWHNDDANDDSWFWEDDLGVLKCTFINTFMNTSSGGIHNIAIHFNSIHASLISELSIEYFIVFAFLAMLIASVFYSLFAFMYKRITLFRHIDDLGNNPINEFYFIENIEKGDTNMLLLSLPGTLILKKIDQKLDSFGYHKSEYHHLNGLKEVGIKFWYYTKVGGTTLDKKFVLLPFFDLKGEDPKNYIDKIKALEGLFVRSDIKVIWVTSIDPFEQIEILKKISLSTYTQRLKNNELNHEAFKLDQDFEKIVRILDDFYLMKYPLEKYSVTSLNMDVSKIGPNYGSFVKKEFIYGHYMHTLGKHYNDMLINLKNTESVNKELLILKVQDICKNYYYSIWSCLSNKEKYILYDLAMDGLTNCKNFTLLTELKDKGVLYFDKRDNTLKIFNKSFREFILTVVDPSEASVLEKEINTIGTSSVIKMILTLFFIAFGIFLFYTQQGFMNRMVGILTATSSLIPTIINLFNLSRNYKVGK